MIQINKQGNAIVIEFTDNDKYLFNGVIELAPNELMVVVDESNMATFKRVSNGDTLFAQLVDHIQINGSAVTKDNIIEQFGSIGYNPGGGGGGGAVSSVNGQTGDVVLTAASLGAITKSQADNLYAAKSELEEKQEVFQVNSPMAFSRDETTQDLHLSIDLTEYAKSSELETTNTNVLNNSTNIEELSGELATTSTNLGTLTTKVNEDSEKIASLDTEMGTANTNITNLQAEVEHKADKTTVYTMTEVNDKLAKKLDKLTAGDNISLTTQSTGEVIISSESKTWSTDYAPAKDYTGYTSLDRGTKAETFIAEAKIGDKIKLSTDIFSIANIIKVNDKTNIYQLGGYKQVTAYIRGYKGDTYNPASLEFYGFPLIAGYVTDSGIFISSNFEDGQYNTDNVILVNKDPYANPGNWHGNVCIKNETTIGLAYEMYNSTIINGTLNYDPYAGGMEGETPYPENVLAINGTAKSGTTAIGASISNDERLVLGAEGTVCYQVTNNYESQIREDNELRTIATQTWVTNQLNNKQDTLVSGTNIKTINGESILGNGNIVIEGGGGTVDTEMSDTSTNAVQNKVIKAYIDSLVGNILAQLQEINGTTA